MAKFLNTKSLNEMLENLKRGQLLALQVYRCPSVNPFCLIDDEVGPGDKRREDGENDFPFKDPEFLRLRLDGLSLDMMIVDDRKS